MLWFRGSNWPRGALSGMRLQQPPPFTFSVSAAECSSHGTLASDGTCECERPRAGYACSACDPAVAPKDCTIASTPDDDAHTSSSAAPLPVSLPAVTGEAVGKTEAAAPGIARGDDDERVVNKRVVGNAAAVAGTTAGSSAEEESKRGPVNLAVDALGARQGGGQVAPVPGWVGGSDDKKYSSRIRDDGAVDADSVVDLQDDRCHF